jgi:hypothetical protein
LRRRPADRSRRRQNFSKNKLCNSSRISGPVPEVVNRVFCSTCLKYFNWSLTSALPIAMSSEYFEATAMALMRSSWAAFFARPLRFLASLASRSGALASPLMRRSA